MDGVFLAPVPSAWAWFVPPMAMLGAWLLYSRPVLGAGIILLASIVSSLAGNEFGRVELALPAMVALYVLARASIPLWLELAFFAGFVLAISFREGATEGAIPTGILAFIVPLVFGRIVAWRADTAMAAAKRAEQLGAIDIARVATSAAEQERQHVPPELSPLTERELEVFREVGRGRSNGEISATLFLTEKTVKTYVNRILGRLGLASRVQAVVLAFETGFVTGEHD